MTFRLEYFFSATTNSDLKTTLLNTGFATLGSLIPDIDFPKSKISKSDVALTGCSKCLSKVVKHKKETLTVWFSLIFAGATLGAGAIAKQASFGPALLVGLLIALSMDLMRLKIGSIAGTVVAVAIHSSRLPIYFEVPDSTVMYCTVSMFLGCLMHLLYDTYNMQGIMWLHPFSEKRYRIGKIFNEIKEEERFLILMGILTVFLIGFYTACKLKFS